VPVALLGAKFATIVEAPPGTMIYTDPPILRWMLEYFHGPVPPRFEARLDNNPLLFAGWVGFFITALNLIPVGQLDGGHMLYALIGRKAHAVAILLLVAAVGFMIYARYPAFGLMVLLLILMGPRHPPTADDTVPLGKLRILLGWLTLAFIFVGFTPRPIVQM
jgi:membrane-associated protease RseP (regulator of RpoE activity)